MLHGSAHRAPAPDRAVTLDAERLDAYVVALAFQNVTARLARKLGGPFRDQLERASLSIVLNLAEGVGRTQPADKARYYAMSRGSASECAALVDVLRARGLAEEALCSEARSLLVRVVQMTTRLEQAMARRRERLSAGGRTAG
jgi:four helix bundle protein